MNICGENRHFAKLLDVMRNIIRTEMKVSLQDIIQTIYLLPEQVLKDVLRHFHHLEYPKNYFLLKPGKPCKHIWFMTQGAVRYFYTNDQGKEMNTWFSLDTQIITDAPSLVNQTPSQESIQLMEDSEMYSIEYVGIQALLQKHHSFALWYIKLVELLNIPVEINVLQSDVAHFNAAQTAAIHQAQKHFMLEQRGFLKQAPRLCFA
jgi:hypothetical protein